MKSQGISKVIRFRPQGGVDGDFMIINPTVDPKDRRIHLRERMYVQNLCPINEIDDEIFQLGGPTTHSLTTKAT